MPAQIYEPRVGRNYRIEIDGGTFVGRVVAWDKDSVLVSIDPAMNEGKELPTDEVRLQRTEITMTEWR